MKDKPIGRASGQGLQDADPISAGYENECCIEERDINDACSQTTNFPLHLTKKNPRQKQQQSNKTITTNKPQLFSILRKVNFLLIMLILALNKS